MLLYTFAYLGEKLSSSHSCKTYGESAALAVKKYIDDNGYFLTILEFQPSAYAKGIYLNVALHFLWNGREVLSLDFPFGRGSFI